MGEKKKFILFVLIGFGIIVYTNFSTVFQAPSYVLVYLGIIGSLLGAVLMIIGVSGLIRNTLSNKVPEKVSEKVISNNKTRVSFESSPTRYFLISLYFFTIFFSTYYTISYLGNVSSGYLQFEKFFYSLIEDNKILIPFLIWLAIYNSLFAHSSPKRVFQALSRKRTFTTFGIGLMALIFGYFYFNPFASFGVMWFIGITAISTPAGILGNWVFERKSNWAKVGLLSAPFFIMLIFLIGVR